MHRITRDLTPSPLQESQGIWPSPPPLESHSAYRYRLSGFILISVSISAGEWKHFITHYGEELEIKVDPQDTAKNNQYLYPKKRPKTGIKRLHSLWRKKRQYHKHVYPGQNTSFVTDLRHFMGGLILLGTRVPEEPGEPCNSAQSTAQCQCYQWQRPQMKPDLPSGKPQKRTLIALRF